MAAHDLFFSYRRADIDRARPLYDALKRSGLNIWFDQTGIPDHAPITEGIRKGIAASKALLAFFSRTYLGSRPCQMELISAWLAGVDGEDVARRRVLIINPESPHFDHIPPAIQDGQSPAWPTDPAGFDELARRIRGHIEKLEGTLLRVSSPPRYFGMRAASAQRFVGRADQFWDLSGKLLATDIGIISGQYGQNVAQIVGMPGNGKSLLAQEYAIRFGPAFPGGIFWMKAFGNPDTRSQDVSRDDQIGEFAHALRVPGIKGLEPQDIPALFWKFLDDAGKRCLWIVDDLASDLDSTGFNAWLAQSTSASTLITTRSHSYQWTHGAIHLDVLKPDEAEQLLALHRKPKDQAEADAMRLVALELGWHPLAVEVAGSYLATGTNSFAEYLSDLRTPRVADGGILELSAEMKALLPTEHSRSIFHTFITSIRQLGPEGQEFLRLASLLAPAPIPLDFVREVVGGKTIALAVDQVDTLSLCEKTGDDSRAVHALVSRTMQTFLAERNDRRAEQLCDSAVRALTERLSGVGDIRTHAGVSGLIVHARHLISIRLADANDAILGGLVAEHDYKRGEFRVARQLQQEVAALRRRILGEEHADTLASLNDLAETMRALGELTTAREILDRVFEARNRFLGEEHPDTLRSMNTLAETMWDQGEIAPARQFQERVIEVCRRVHGDEHPDTLESMHNLAVTLWSQGDFIGARRLDEQVLEVRRRVLGDDHQSTLASMNNLAGTLESVGDLAGARQLQKEVIEALRRISGDEHPDTLTAMHNLSSTLRTGGDLAAAREIQQRVLEAFHRVLGSEHPRTLTSMNNLALTLQGEGDLAGARRLHEKVLDALRRTLGEMHPYTLKSLDNLARTLRQLGDIPAAQTHEAELARLRGIRSEGVSHATNA